MYRRRTKDASAIGRTTPEQRTQVFPHLPKGGKYELVLHDAEHMQISYAAYGMLLQRYGTHPHPDTPPACSVVTQDLLDDRMAALGFEYGPSTDVTLQWATY